MTGTGDRRLADVVRAARSRLAEAGLADAAIETRMLIGGLLGLDATEMFTGGDRILSESEVAKIDAALERRLKREPVHRILGARDFHGLHLTLSPQTLEPRPDTEVLVEAVLPHAWRIAAGEGMVDILDLGVGTGAIGLALLKACPEAQVLGTDIAGGALATARENAHINGVAERYRTLASDWFSQVTGRFHIIVSNPPYIASKVIEALEPEVRNFDPMAALDGGPDGLDAYRAIARGAAAHLMPDGIVALEIGYDQTETVSAIFAAQGFVFSEMAKDYGGNDRVLVFMGNRSG